MQHPRAPVLAGRERHLPVPVREALPPFQLDDPLESQPARQFAHAPRHDANLGRGQFADARFVKMIEVGVGQQHQVNRGQVFDLEARVLDPLQQEEPVREIRVDQHIQIRELHKERRMPDPRQRHLAFRKRGKRGTLVVAGAFGEQRLPDHLVKEGARIEGVGGSELLKRPRDASVFETAGLVMAGIGIHGWPDDRAAYRRGLNRWQSKPSHRRRFNKLNL